VVTLVSCIVRSLFEIKGMVNWRSLKDRFRSDLRLFIQHLTTSTKLHIAHRYFNKLREIAPTDLMCARQGKETISIELPSSLTSEVEDYFDWIEAYFYTLRSCIDSFLWELNLFFKLGLKQVGNLRKFRESINEKYKDKEITKLLNDLQNKPWFNYLRDVRNYLTHRVLSEVASEGSKLYLPSNLETVSYSKRKEFEVIPCLDNLYINTKEFLEKGYGLLVNESIYSKNL